MTRDETKEQVMSGHHDVGAGIVLMAFVMGAIGGAAVAALLLAPGGGVEARRSLGERVSEGRGRTVDAVRHSSDFLKRQREHLATAIEEGRDAYRKARDADRMAASDVPERDREPRL